MLIKECEHRAKQSQLLSVLLPSISLFVSVADTGWLWGSERLVSTLSNSRNRCVPDSGLMVMVHLASAALDRNDEYSFIGE